MKRANSKKDQEKSRKFAAAVLFWFETQTKHKNQGVYFDLKSNVWDRYPKTSNNKVASH